MQNNKKNAIIWMEDAFDNLWIKYGHEDNESNMILDQKIDIVNLDQGILIRQIAWYQHIAYMQG